MASRHRHSRPPPVLGRRLHLCPTPSATTSPSNVLRYRSPTPTSRALYLASWRCKSPVCARVAHGSSAFSHARRCPSRSIETGTATLTDVDVVDAGVHPSGQPAVLVLHYAQLTMLVRRMCVAVCGCVWLHDCGCGSCFLCPWALAGCAGLRLTLRAQRTTFTRCQAASGAAVSAWDATKVTGTDVVVTSAHAQSGGAFFFSGASTATLTGGHVTTSSAYVVCCVCVCVSVDVPMLGPDTSTLLFVGRASALATAALCTWTS